MTNKDCSLKKKYSKGKAKSIRQQQLELMEMCHLVLDNNNVTTEYEAVGINVAKKLEKMELSQAIYAEMLINNILAKGIFNQLNSSTIVHELPQQSNTLSNSYIVTTPTSSTDNLPNTPVFYCSKY